MEDASDALGKHPRQHPRQHDANSTSDRGARPVSASTALVHPSGSIRDTSALTGE